MAYEIDIDSDEPETFLAWCLTDGDAQLYDALFVKAPGIGDHGFHTYHPMRGSGGVPDADFELGEMKRGDHVRLYFEPTPDYNPDSHYLDRMERVDVSEPSDYETVGDSELPLWCPECGRTASAVLEASTPFESAVADHADTCTVGVDRMRWFGFHSPMIYVH